MIRATESVSHGSNRFWPLPMCSFVKSDDKTLQPLTLLLSSQLITE